jgi:DNA polymerase-3 subunit epsilon
MDLLLNSLSFVIFDLETTGLYPEEGDEMIEIGAVVVENGELNGQEFQTFVNPQRSIPEIATKISGLKDSDVKNAPLASEALKKFFDFAGSRIWVAQNARFDLGFVMKKMRDLKIPPRQNVVIDTIGISKILFPYETSHNLDVLMARMGVVRTGDRHRSLDDSRYTALVFIEFLKLLEKQGIATLPQIESAFIKPDSVMKAPKQKARSLFG